MQIDNQNSALFYKSLLWAEDWCSSHLDGYATIVDSDGDKRNQECSRLPYYMEGIAIGHARSEARSDPPARGRGSAGGDDKGHVNR